MKATTISIILQVGLHTWPWNNLEKNNMKFVVEIQTILPCFLSTLHAFYFSFLRSTKPRASADIILDSLKLFLLLPHEIASKIVPIFLSHCRVKERKLLARNAILPTELYSSYFFNHKRNNSFMECYLSNLQKNIQCKKFIFWFLTLSFKFDLNNKWIIFVSITWVLIILVKWASIEDQKFKLTKYESTFED